MTDISDPCENRGEGREPYITITSGMRGFFAVLLSWDEECGMYTPWNTGIGSYRNSEDAVPEAKEWAEGEGIKFRR